MSMEDSLNFRPLGKLLGNFYVYILIRRVAFDSWS
jgi:hypothetical protein